MERERNETYLEKWLDPERSLGVVLLVRHEDIIDIAMRVQADFRVVVKGPRAIYNELVLVARVVVKGNNSSESNAVFDGSHFD